MELVKALESDDGQNQEKMIYFSNGRRDKLNKGKNIDVFFTGYVTQLSIIILFLQNTANNKHKL